METIIQQMYMNAKNKELVHVFYLFGEFFFHQVLFNQFQNHLLMTEKIWHDKTYYHPVLVYF